MSWSLERRSLRLGPVTLQFLCALQTIALPELSCVFVLRWSGVVSRWPGVVVWRWPGVVFSRWPGCFALAPGGLLARCSFFLRPEYM